MQPILAGLPLELQPRLKNPDAGALTVCIPLEKILAQLSRGSVKIPFGELRQAAPDLFTPEEDRDGTMVPLPLGEILARLNPALITRRRVQKKVEVPADISSPFDQRNQGLIFSVGPTKPESVPTASPASAAGSAGTGHAGSPWRPYLRAHAAAARRSRAQRARSESCSSLLALARAEHQPATRPVGSGARRLDPSRSSASRKTRERV